MKIYLSEYYTHLSTLNNKKFVMTIDFDVISDKTNLFIVDRW